MTCAHWNPSPVARTDASGNGASNVTLRLVPERGKKRHGARQPSGMSLSKPIAQLIGEGCLWWGGSMRHFFVSSFVVRECWEDEDALVIHMGMIVGMRDVSISM